MRTKKKCPRCEFKVPSTTIVCPSCQLNFAKFEESTNSKAKDRLKAGESDQVLLRTGCPTDVNRTVLLLWCIFLGFAGAHYYKVGRYKMGVFCSVFFLVGIINTVMTAVLKLEMSGNLYQIFTLLVLGWGAVLCIWLIDIVKIAVNKFKIPVSR